MASSDSQAEVESIVESDTNKVVDPIYDVPRSFRRQNIQTSDAPSDSAVDQAISMVHTVNTGPAKPEKRKFLVQELSTDESGYVKMTPIEDSNESVTQNLTAEQSLHTNIDDSKLEKDTNQLGSTDIRHYIPNLPPRPTTTLNPSDIPLKNLPQRHTRQTFKSECDIYYHQKQSSPKIKERKSVPVPFYEGSETLSSAFGKPTRKGQQILIRGVPDRLSTKDIIQRLEADIIGFENAFEDLRVNRTNREAIVTLRSVKAVDDLLGRVNSGEKFTLGDSEVDILPYNQPPFDRRKVLLSGLARDTAEKDICTYVESILLDRPYSVVFGESPGTALLCLENQDDALKLKSGLQHYSFGEDQIWHLSAVERTRKLRVKITAGETTAEALKAYFEQKDLSEGGAIESLIHRHVFEDYIVTFENYKDAENVSGRTNHTLNDTKLDVSIYPSCLDQSEEFLTRIPSPMKLHNLDPFMCRFLRRSQRYSKKLEYAVKRHFGRLLWPPEKSKDCLQVVCDVQEDDRVAKGKIRDWAKIPAAVVETCKMLHVQYAYCALEVLENLKNEIRKMEVSDPEAINVYPEENVVVIAGEEKFVESIGEKVQHKIQEMEHIRDGLGQNITKILTLKAHEMELIQETTRHAQLQNVKIEFENQKGRVRINGKKELVDKALSEVKETVKGLPKQDIEGINMLGRKLLETEKTRKYFKKKLREANVTGDLALVADDTIVLYSVTQEELRKAAYILKMTLKNTTIKLRSNIGEGGKQFLAKLEHEYSDVLRTELCKDTLSFVSLDTLHEEIKEKIQHYVDSRLDSTEIIQIDPGTFRYMLNYKRHDIINIMQQHKSRNVEIDIIDKPYRKGFMISGEKEKCKLAIVELNVIIGSIIRSDHIVSWDRSETFLQTIEGKKEIRTIEYAEKCVLTLPSSLPLVPLSEKRSSFAASCKIGLSEITVVSGDILETEANFIVCPTLSSLELKRGLGGILVEKGGFAIQKYCNDHIERVKSLKDGDVFVGNAGSLTCKGIIYMILSNWRDGRENEESNLSQAVYNCLKEADARKSLSIAFPPVGIGQFGYPKEKVANILMGTIKEYLKENGTSTFLRHVFVCDLKGGVTFLLVQEIQKGFGQITVPTTESSSEDMTDTSQQRVTGKIFSGLKTEIVKGSMLSEESDVVVNSTNSNLDLRVGKLSKALLKEGGENLAAECNKKYPEGISLGQLAETTGGLLKCKAIFHGILVPWNQDPDRAEIILRNFVRDCLITADKRHYSSLSFPVLGTGVLKFPPNVVADSIFDTIEDFEKDFPDSSIKTVRIVIQPNDEDLIKEFEKHKLCYSSPPRKLSRKALRQNCKLSNVIINAGTTFTTTIDQVTLRIEHGDLTKSTASVIVNSVARDLNLNKGQISKAILKAGGMSIQHEAYDNKETFTKEGIVMTNAGQLLCQKIIHVKAKTHLAELKKVVMRCLEECEKAELNSVSFPALGTGGKGFPASQIARTMIDAFKEYIRGEDFKGKLKSIAIIVYRENMLECFIKEAKDSSSRKSFFTAMFDMFLTDEIQQEKTIVQIYSESTETAKRVLKRLNELQEKIDTSLIKAESLYKS